MLELFNQKLASFASLHKNKSVWRKLVTVLASIAVFCVTYALILPAITAEQEVFCGLEEHNHTEECYTYEPVLICGYGSDADAAAELPESAPESAERSGAEVPVTVEAAESETVEAIAEAVAEPETVEAIAEAVAEPETVEAIAEAVAEPETAAAMDEAAEPVMEAAAETESRILPIAPTVQETVLEYKNAPAAEQTEAEHVHTVDCYEYVKVLVCEKEEHTHAMQCYSDSGADTESAADWQAMADRMKFSGDIRRDVIAFAETQLGYTESEKNYVVLEDGVSTHGYTRYGDWYGDPYGDWCAMFCSFCLHYSGVEDYPLEANCQRWINVLSETYGENGAYYRTADSYEPKVGDLVFFDWDGYNPATPEARVSDHVGLVCEVEAAAEETPARIKIIEGNHNRIVGHRSFELTDPQIMGYGVLTEDDVIVIEREYKGEDFTVYVSYGKDAGIPEEAELVVRELMPDTREFKNCYEQTLETLKAQDDQVEDIGFIRFFDVSFCVGRKEIEPSAPVNVRIVYDEPILMDDNTGEMTIHFADSGDIELPETSVSQSVEYAPENSVNTFEFTTDSFSVIGAGTVNYKEQTATYYQKVDTLEVGQTYLIVSTEGNMALRRGNTNNYQNIDLLPVKGFPGYYTVDGGANARLKWGLLAADGTTAANVYRLQSRANDAYYLRLGGDTVVSTDANDRNILFAYDAQKGSWTLRCNNSQTYYLLNSGADFTRGSGTTRVNRTDVDNVARQFSIYKEVNTTLHIPDDVVGGGSGSGSGSGSTKPTYPDDAAEGLSGAIEQGFTQAGLPADVQNAEGTVKWAYASDPATSEIEQYYKQSSYLEHVKRDGMVMTDKSVIFGKDDYNAFSSYESGEFSAALSALGQDYHLQIVDQVRIPVDVMFVLDVSGSMKEETSNEGETRLQALVKATNNAIRQIMEDNPNNRAGIALYSSGGQVLLPLDHYDYDHSHAFDETNAYVHIVGDTTYTTTATNYVQPTDYVKTQKGLGNATFQQAWGTYTQYGIQLGAQELLDNTDTTYTQTLHAGTEYAQDITVVRKPVMILLSDGDPTHCTPNYTDVLNGPHYGNGQTGSGNNKGVLGYYTILTANYFKRMVGINYETQATFYTIGLGINAEGIEDFSDSSGTGDHYKRAVLNPSAANIADLNNDSAKNHETTADMLKELLNNESDAYYVEVGTPGTTKFPQLGPTQSKVSIINNPYTGDYSYADGAYFGNLNADDLTEIFSDIITSNIKVKTYGFMLNQRVGSGAKVTIVDPIGEGMEVNMDLGQRPILRYNGQNFAATAVTTSGNVTTLVYEHIATTTDGSGGVAGERSVDLSEISVTITTADGMQTVQMQVPETILPSYTPGPDGSGYYYEELPVRLIYKVRLTEASKAAVRNLSDGEELTFYTNEWNKGTSAYAAQNPHEDNPYYCDVTYFKEDGVTVDPNNPRRNHEYKEPLTYQKTENPTATAHTSFDSKASAFSSSGAVVPNGTVTMALGNNGKLVFKASTGADLEATKVWKDEENHDLADPGVASITLQLMQNGVPYGAPVTVTAADEWKHLFSDLPMVDSEGNSYVYTVEEADIFGFAASYSALTYNSERGLWEVTVTNRKLPTKDLPVEKRWSDTGHDGDTVTVRLYANGADTGLSVVLNQGNNWRYVFEGIPARDEDNHEIVYTLREDPFPNYTATYTEGNIDFGSTEWTQVAANSSFSTGNTYQIRYEDDALALVGGSLVRVTPDDTDTTQQWRINGTGSISIRNVGTGQYLAIGNNTYSLQDTAQTLTLDNNGKIYRRVSGSNRYLRYSTSNAVIQVNIWDSTNRFTFWRLDEVDDTRPGLIVTNSPRSGIEISADKIWQNVPDSAKTEVTLKVYDVTISDRNALDTGSTLILNSANGWHASILLDNPAVGHTYAVVETEISGFAPSYNQEGTIRIDGQETKAYYAASPPGNNALLEVEVTNELSYTLPQTGGSGIIPYTIGGLLLMTASAAMYILIVRRRRERGGFD